jgi:hypothetical protein
MNGSDFLSLVLIAIGLSADCFAVALSASVTAKNPSRLQVLRMAAMFGLSRHHARLGGLGGQTMVKVIAAYDHFVAFALLASSGKDDLGILPSKKAMKIGRCHRMDLLTGRSLPACCAVRWGCRWLLMM